MAEGGKSVVGWIVGVFLVVPLLMTTCSTVFFCRKVKEIARPPAASSDCPRDSACAAATDALEAAGRADSDALRARLADPAWLERLPPAATGNAAEKGQWYLRSLLGRPPGTLEELRDRPLEWRIAQTRTAVDGASATVDVEFRNLPGQAEIGQATLALTRVGAQWKVAP